MVSLSRAVSVLLHPQLRYRHYVLILLLLGFSIQSLNRQTIVIMAQSIKAEFGLSDAELGFVSGFVFSIPYSIMLLPIGMLVDRVNRRNLLVINLGLWSCFTAITSLTHSLLQLAGLRAAVAAAEAGYNPNAVTVLADLYDRQSRATAIGIMYGGTTLATIVGYPIIAYIGDNLGWRMAFVAAGVPGILLAAIIYLTVSEPSREKIPAEDAKALPSVRETFHFFGGQKSVLNLMAAMTVTSVVGTGTLAWMVALLMRKHGMPVSQAGYVISLYFGIPTFLSHVFGSTLSDWLGRKDVRWYGWLPAVVAASNGVIMVGGIGFSPLAGTLVTFALWGMMAALQYGPVLGVLQSLVMPRMRGIASSFITFLISFVGLGVGPFLVGLLSDIYMPRAGNHSLQWALGTASLLQIWALFHFLRAARAIPADLRRVESLSR